MENNQQPINQEEVVVENAAPVAEPVAVDPAQQKSKIVAGILGILLGGFGVHNFYLGFTKKAILQIVLNFLCFGIGGIWGLIEGIMILIGKIDKDAAGVPLKD